jgi:hypothetical protein
MIMNVTPTAWEALLAALRDGDPRTQRAVLESVFAVAGGGRLPEGGADKLAAVVPSLDRKALAEWRILAAGPRVVVQAAALLLGRERLGGGVPWLMAAMAGGVRERSVSVASVLAQPAALLAPALAALGLVPYRTPAHEEQVRTAAGVIVGNPGLVVILGQRLLHLLAESVQDALLYPERRDLLTVLAAAAAQSRDVLAPAVALDGWEAQLAEAARRSFFRAARVSALRLLGSGLPAFSAPGGRLSVHVAEAVRSALRDTPEALAAAQQLVAAVGGVDDAALGFLTGALADECPSVAWNAAAVLSALVRNRGLTDEQRRSVGEALKTAAADPRASRAVYVLDEVHVPDRGLTLSLRYLGRLGQEADRWR